MTSFSVSTLVSPALRVPISRLFGQALVILYRLIGDPSKSYTMIAPFLRDTGILPNRESLIHFSKLWSAVSPRVRVTSPAFGRPGSFFTMYLPSFVFCFSSMTSCSILRPETSEICLMITPSMSSPNEWPTEVSRSGSAMASLLLGHEAGAAAELRQPEDDELGWFHRSYSDLAEHLAGIDRPGRVRLAGAPEVERLARGQPEQRALAPLGDQERGDRAADLGPQCVVVRLEHDPLGAVENGLFEIVEQPADVEVPPCRVGGERAGAPHPDAAAGERAQAVDADRVEQVGLPPSDHRLERDRPTDDLVRRSLVHATGVVVAAPDPGHVPARRGEDVRPAGRVEDLDPRPVQGGELRVVAGDVDAPVLDLLGVQSGWRVEDGDPVPHQLAVRDHRLLHGLEALVVERALLVGAHQVGDGHHGDLLDRLKAAEAGAGGHVADVVVRLYRPRLLRCRLLGRGELHRPLLRPLQHTGRGHLLYPDRLGLRVDDSDHVLLVALGGGQPVELLSLTVADLHDQPEAAVRRVVPTRVGDLDGHLRRPAAAAALQRLHPVPAENGLRPGGQLLGRPAVDLAVRAAGADADHVAVAAAVHEVAVHRVRQVGARDELPERRGELAPVAHQGRFVHRAPLG